MKKELLISLIALSAFFCPQIINSQNQKIFNPQTYQMEEVQPENFYAIFLLAQSVDFFDRMDTTIQVGIKKYGAETNELKGRTIKFVDFPGLLLQETTNKSTGDQFRYLLFANDTVGQIKVWWSGDSAVVFPDWDFTDVRFEYTNYNGVWYQEKSTDNFTEADTLRMAAAYDETERCSFSFATDETMWKINEMIRNIDLWSRDESTKKEEPLKILPVFDLKTRTLYDLVLDKYSRSTSYDTMSFHLDALELSFMVQSAEQWRSSGGWDVYKTEKPIREIFGSWQYAIRKFSKNKKHIHYNFFDQEGNWLRGYDVSFIDIHVWSTQRLKANKTPNFKKIFEE